MNYTKFLLCLTLSSPCFAQQVVDVSDGKGISQSTLQTVFTSSAPNVKYVNLIDGSPLFSESWMKGIVVGVNGQRYGTNIIRLDDLNNEITYLNPLNQVFLVNLKAKEIFLEDTVQHIQYHLIHSGYGLLSNVADQGWYQVLDTGKVKLYKVTTKTLLETKPYGSATYEQRIKSLDKYFIQTKTGLVQVKKPEELIAYLPGKRNEIYKYINEHDNKKMSTELRLTQVIRYYNSVAGSEK